ncbi:crotonase/enoyl-CoA hydratase family protein [Novosphingobium sp. HII-3]|uniref:crotonase/enoyl-CoA hydratase family protein n=1 Tax=Novosphingobium sp. HII-3 TaxID=2075565 RepID=UPI000CDB53DC|nr:crotonase/enoyl-CoA hydratase family protein [Novosphingobium sp. HII-3]
MPYETITYEVVDRIATITLSRADRLNAFTETMMNEMIDAFDHIDSDDDVRAVIVTGAGRAFCAGADLGDGAGTFDAVGIEDSPVRADGSLDYSKESARDGGGRLTLRIHRCLKPVIAAINGPAVGIGATMTLPMDIRLASENARIGFVFSRRGIVPEAASSFFLPRIVGISQALEWCFSGRVFQAAEALQGGLVKAVLPAEELLPAAREIAREIVENTSPVSIALIRQMMWRGLGMTDPMQAHQVDSRGILSRGRSRDVAEGVTAFLEKRSAAFPDRVSSDMPDYFPWWDEAAYG